MENRTEVQVSSKDNTFTVLVYVGEDKAGFISGFFDFSKKTMTVLHTVVKPEYRGQGLAKVLLLSAVSYAREKGYKIIPVCSYVLSVFEKDRSFDDVYEKSEE